MPLVLNSLVCIKVSLCLGDSANIQFVGAMEVVAGDYVGGILAAKVAALAIHFLIFLPVENDVVWIG